MSAQSVLTQRPGSSGKNVKYILLFWFYVVLHPYLCHLDMVWYGLFLGHVSVIRDFRYDFLFLGVSFQMQK